MQEEDKQLTAKEYFDYIKNKKFEMTDEFLDNFQVVVHKELSKAMTTGQNLMIKRLAYTMGVIERERKLLQTGINVYVLKDDIEDYIKNVSNKDVKIIELEFYPRSIPDEVVERVSKLNELKIFDRYYVVFTDYTGETKKEIQKENNKKVREKDPILFGTFEQKIDNIWDIHDRFYFIADWVDEYCDLTLAKMVSEMSKQGKEIAHDLAIPEATPEAVRTYLNNLKELENNRFHIQSGKKSIFQKVSLAWKTLTS